MKKIFVIGGMLLSTLAAAEKHPVYQDPFFIEMASALKKQFPYSCELLPKRATAMTEIDAKDFRESTQVHITYYCRDPWFNFSVNGHGDPETGVFKYLNGLHVYMDSKITDYNLAGMMTKFEVDPDPSYSATKVISSPFIQEFYRYISSHKAWASCRPLLEKDLMWREGKGDKGVIYFFDKSYEYKNFNLTFRCTYGEPSATTFSIEGQYFPSRNLTFVRSITTGHGAL